MKIHRLKLLNVVMKKRYHINLKLVDLLIIQNYNNDLLTKITKEQFGISFINTTNEIFDFIIEEIFYEELNIHTKSTKKIKLLYLSSLLVIKI